MKYIECPDIYSGNKKALFLAGGISNCTNWQIGMADLLKNEDLAIINPRRKNFDPKDRKMEIEQISWEFEAIKKADMISFWFPKETLCPITLYELGKVSMTDKQIFIGVDPEYSRKRDVEIQTSIIRPEIKIVYSLTDLAKQIKKVNQNSKNLERVI